MSSLKRIFSLVSVMALALSMTACGNETGIQVIEDRSNDPEFLSFFSLSTMSNSDVKKYWIELFTETYDKQVYIDFDLADYYSGEGLSYRELLVKRMESSAPDDLYIINAEDVLEFEQKGYWLDLSDTEASKSLSEAALYQSTYNGKVFSIPLSFTGFGFLWNVDMLTKYGLTIPKNLSEFTEVCEVLKSNGILPYGANKGYALTVPVMCVGFSELYGSDDRSERIDALNSGEAAVSDYLFKGFTFLNMMIENGYLDAEQALASTPHNEDFEMFMAEECAFVCVSMGEISNISEKPFQMKITGLPVLEDGAICVYGADQRLCVNPNSKHLETALQFIEMVGSVEALDKSAELAGVNSSSKTIDDEKDVIIQDFAQLLQRTDQIPNQDFSLSFNTWENIRNVARELCGGISVNEACDMMDERQSNEISLYSLE